MNKLSKNIFYGITIGLSILLIVWIFAASKDNKQSPVGLSLVLMYVLFIAAIVTALALAIKSLIDNPKSLKNTLIGVGVLFLLLVIGYFLDSHEISESWAEFGVTTPFFSGIIGGSLIATWLILAGAIFLTVFASIKGIFKKS